MTAPGWDARYVILDARDACYKAHRFVAKVCAPCPEHLVLAVEAAYAAGQRAERAAIMTTIREACARDATPELGIGHAPCCHADDVRAALAARDGG